MKPGAAEPDGGDTDRRASAEALYEAARALPAEDRQRFLQDACREDDALRAELLSLVAHAEAAEAFFERLATAVVPTDAAPPRVPPTIGHYRILACIGVGGMGAVYRARDTRLERDVALKLLPPNVDPAFDAGERLVLEARAAAALEHPNVCTVYEIGRTAIGLPYIAMAFYHGETLKERLRRGPLPVVEAVDIAAQIARGLAAAHARGIVHRDVKPGNVMLTADGTVKLLDFGLARLADAGVTRPGVTPGTVAYMSPEQARGDAVGPSSDLWSLGVVLYEALAGERPFRGGNDRAILDAIAHAEPASIRQSNPAVSPALERTVGRLLEKNPTGRYRDAVELLTDLERAAAPAIPASPSWRIRLFADRRRRVSLTVLGTMALALIAVALWPRVGADTTAPDAQAVSPAVTSDGAKTIAVLPFTNVNRAAEDEYFSDGLTEELIGVLSRVSALRVAARTSAFAFKNESRDIREIGRSLNVGAILEGSVRRSGDSIRVAARLIDAENGFPVWSGTYDRELTDVFAIQRDLAVSIASALEVGVTPTDRARLARQPTSNPEAFALYLKGRHFWHQRTPSSYERAIEYFEKAIDADPLFAPPVAGLAAVYSQQTMFGALDPARANLRIKEFALRAIALDDDLAEAHSILGIYLHSHEWDTEAAEREHLRAVEIDPGQPAVHYYYGNFLRSLGRVEEAIAEQTRAVALDPLDPALSETLAFTYLRARRPLDALAHVRNALELDSTYWRAHAVLGNVYEALNQPELALRSFERANELAGAATHRTREDIARVLARTGHREEALRLVEASRAEADRTGQYVPAVATALLALGDEAGALDWLEQSVRRRHTLLRGVGGDPRFLPFENIPGFVELLRRVGTRP